jgi:hypothetical protein
MKTINRLKNFSPINKIILTIMGAGAIIIIGNYFSKKNKTGVTITGEDLKIITAGDVTTTSSGGTTTTNSGSGGGTNSGSGGTPTPTPTPTPTVTETPITGLSIGVITPVSELKTMIGVPFFSYGSNGQLSAQNLQIIDAGNNIIYQADTPDATTPPAGSYDSDGNGIIFDNHKDFANFPVPFGTYSLKIQNKTAQNRNVIGGFLNVRDYYAYAPYLNNGLNGNFGMKTMKAYKEIAPAETYITPMFLENRGFYRNDQSNGAGNFKKKIHLAVIVDGKIYKKKVSYNNGTNFSNIFQDINTTVQHKVHLVEDPAKFVIFEVNTYGVNGTGTVKLIQSSGGVTIDEKYFMITKSTIWYGNNPDWLAINSDYCENYKIISNKGNLKLEADGNKTIINQ